MCGVFWLPWKPPRLLLPVKGPYNWVVLLYYSPWFLDTMTSQSSPHLTMQVSAYLMGSSLSNTLPGWLCDGDELEKDKEISDMVIGC